MGARGMGPSTSVRCTAYAAIRIADCEIAKIDNWVTIVTTAVLGKDP